MFEQHVRAMTEVLDAVRKEARVDARQELRLHLLEAVRGHQELNKKYPGINYETQAKALQRFGEVFLAEDSENVPAELATLREWKAQALQVLAGANVENFQGHPVADYVKDVRAKLGIPQ